jgi:hypothetical protein
MLAIVLIQGVKVTIAIVVVSDLLFTPDNAKIIWHKVVLI